MLLYLKNFSVVSLHRAGHTQLLYKNNNNTNKANHEKSIYPGKAAAINSCGVLRVRGF